MASRNLLFVAGGNVCSSGAAYGLGRRHIQALLAFFCICLTYSLRINISVSIVAMTDANHNPYNFTVFPEWTESQRGYILSSFFWGYVVTQVPGGILAQRFGPKMFLLFAMTTCSLFALIIPVCVKLGGWQVMCALRVLQGLCQVSGIGSLLWDNGKADESGSFQRIFFLESRKFLLIKWQNIFFLAPRFFFLAAEGFFQFFSEKCSCCKKKKKLAARKKLFCYFIKRNFLGVRKNYVSEGYFLKSDDEIYYCSQRRRPWPW